MARVAGVLTPLPQRIGRLEQVAGQVGPAHTSTDPATHTGASYAYVSDGWDMREGWDWGNKDGGQRFHTAGYNVMFTDGNVRMVGADPAQPPEVDHTVTAPGFSAISGWGSAAAYAPWIYFEQNR